MFLGTDTKPFHCFPRALKRTVTSTSKIFFISSMLCLIYNVFFSWTVKSTSKHYHARGPQQDKGSFLSPLNNPLICCCVGGVDTKERI